MHGNKGKKFSDERRKKMSLARKGKPKSEEHRKTMFQKGNFPWNKGKGMSSEKWKLRRKEISKKYYYSEKGQVDYKSKRLKKFGLSLNNYNQMYVNQNGLCAICKGNPKGYATLSIDHNHLTGKVRGLLCITCNSGIGFFKDNIDFLKKALDYLTKYGE